MAATVGVVGLGTMGGRIAGRLLDTGHTVYGYNRSPERAAALAERGLIVRPTPRAVAEAAGVVISIVTNDDALAAIATGHDGILAGLASGTLYVDMSTVGPDTSRAISQRVRALGAEMLDAPVSGSAPAAEQGSLSIMVGGDRDAYERAEPLLKQIGTTVTHVGASGQGLVMKLAVNVSLAAQMVAFSEGVLLAQRGGIDPAVAAAVLAGSSVGSPMLQARAPFLLHPPRPAWFSVDLMQKDLHLALDAAARLDVPLPTGTAADQVMSAARRAGHGGDDITSAYAALASA